MCGQPDTNLEPFRDFSVFVENRFHFEKLFSEFDSDRFFLFINCAVNFAFIGQFELRALRGAFDQFLLNIGFEWLALAVDPDSRSAATGRRTDVIRVVPSPQSV